MLALSVTSAANHAPLAAHRSCSLVSRGLRNPHTGHGATCTRADADGDTRTATAWGMVAVSGDARWGDPVVCARRITKTPRQWGVLFCASHSLTITASWLGGGVLVIGD